MQTKIRKGNVLDTHAICVEKVAVEIGLEVHQLNFVSAYLNGEIKEESFMEVPDELHRILDDEETQKFAGRKVCLIKKAIYGLKQSVVQESRQKTANWCQRAQIPACICTKKTRMFYSW